ncbi:MAG: hypothetical protein C0404_01720 [Verrucomicrobia bacterium]|nr:hypothetical protein [Verrucomicrobiota bacterium]
MEPTESRFRMWIASLDQGLGQLILRAFIYFCVLAGIFGVYAWTQFRGLRDPAAMEYSQLARNLAQGRGFTTQCIRPLDMWYLESAGKKYDVAAFPDIRNAPAYPGVLACALALVRPSSGIELQSLYAPEKFVVVPLGILFSLLTGVFLFLLATRLFTGRIAVVSVLVFFLTESVMADSISGTALPMLTMLVTAVAYTALVAIQNRMSGRPTMGWFLPLTACALLAGVAFLAGYTALVVVPVVLVFIGASLDRDRWPAILVFLTFFMLLAVPWLIRNQVVSGSFFGSTPYTLLNHTYLYEGNELDQSLSPEIHNVRIASAMKVKLTRNLLGIYDMNLRTIGGGIIICFFLVSFFFRFDRQEADLFRWCVLLGVILMMVVAALCGGGAERMLNIFLPLVIVYGCALLFFLVEKAEFVEPGWETFLAGVLVLLTALPTAVRIAAAQPVRPYPPYSPMIAAYVGETMGKGEVLATDIPWATAWYGSRISVLLPQSIEDFTQLNGTRAKISGIYITTETANRPYADTFLGGPLSSWLPVINRKVPPDFPFKHATAFPSDGNDQIFLSDKSRWRDAAGKTSGQEQQKPAVTNEPAVTNAVAPNAGE